MWHVSLLSGPVLVITEYCSLGDLLNFLRQKAETFVNFVMNIPEIMESSKDYKNIYNQKQFIRRCIIKDKVFKSQSIRFYMPFIHVPLSPGKAIAGFPVSRPAATWR